jgi:hypothetical protein
MHMKKFLTLFTLMLSGCGTLDFPLGKIDYVTQFPVSVPVVIDKEKYQRPLLLSMVVVDIPFGTVYGKWYFDYVCIYPRKLVWKKEVPEVWKIGPYHNEFNSVVRQYGYQTLPQSESLFSEQKLQGDELIIGAKLKNIEEIFCNTIGSETNSRGEYKGSANMTVKWEVYSIADGKVVYTAETKGSAIGYEFVPVTNHRYYARAFGNAFRQLLTDEKFLKIITDKPVAKKTIIEI